MTNYYSFGFKEAHQLLKDLDSLNYSNAEKIAYVSDFVYEYNYALTVRRSLLSTNELDYIRGAHKVLNRFLESYGIFITPPRKIG